MIITKLEARRGMEDPSKVLILWCFKDVEEGLYLSLKLPDPEAAKEIVRQVQETAAALTMYVGENQS